MRFSQFLNEEGRATEQILEQVERLCKPYFQEIGASDKHLLRGMNRSFYIPDGNILSVPEDRQPVDTIPQIHTVIDDWFLQNFGHRYRSNVVFASGSDRMARAYGRIHVIYPIGDFDFIWSPVIKDAYLLHTSVKSKVEPDDNVSLAAGGEMAVLARQRIIKRKIEMIIDLLDDAKYKDYDLPGALESGHEIMINCKRYFIFSVTDPLWQEWANYKV